MRALKSLIPAAFVVLYSATCGWSQIKFVQLTDPHIYDGKKAGVGDDEEASLEVLKGAIRTINELHTRERYAFVALTGDLGIEEIINEVLREEKPTTELRAVLEKRETIRTKLELKAKALANILNTSNVSTWLFVPGNNDLFDEQPATLEFYVHFFNSLRAQLGNLNRTFQIIDLCARAGGKWPLYPVGQYTFVGFNNASFKNNNNPQRLSVAPAQVVGNQDCDLQLKGRESLDGNTGSVNADDLAKTQVCYVQDVSRAIKKLKHQAEAEKRTVYFYIFYHIPEIDDPYLALGNPSEGRILKINTDKNTYFNELRKTPAWQNASIRPHSSWFVNPLVYDTWVNLVRDDAVRGLFAGHFHDWRRDSYESSHWLRTLDYSHDSLSKLHVCPPLSRKLQDGVPSQARGFAVVSIDQKGMVGEQAGNGIRIYWYDQSTGTFAAKLDARSVRDPAGGLKAMNGYLGLILVLLLIGVAGLVGGSLTHYLSRESPGANEPRSLRIDLFVGIVAAFLVPLFLSVTSSTLLESLLEAGDLRAQISTGLRFFGFCVIAAISARTFIQSLSGRLLAQEAKQLARRADKKADKAQQEVERMVDRETEPSEGDLAPLAESSTDPTTKNLLDAFDKSAFEYRTLKGLAKQTGLTLDDVKAAIAEMERDGIVAKREGPKGTRWHLTAKGREMDRQ